MNRIAFSLCTLLALTSASAAEKRNASDLLALDDVAFVRAAKEEMYSADQQYSPAELLAVAERLAQTRSDAAEEKTRAEAFRNFFRSACEKSGPEAVDALARIFVSDREVFGRHLVSALAPLWIKREMAALGSSQMRVSLAAVDVDLPAKLADAPPALVSAWKVFKTADYAYEKNLTPDEREASIGYQENERAFAKLLDDVVLGRGEKMAEKLLLFRWSGWCGTGMDLLLEPQSIAVFMALLHERRIAEAVGAILRIQSRELVHPSERHPPIRIEFLRLCGLDWEQVLAGAQIDREVSNRSWFDEPDARVRELAAFGSDRAAQLLLDLARRAEGEKRRIYVNALGALVDPVRDRPRSSADEVSVIYNSETVIRLAKTPISSALQIELLHFIEEATDVNASRELAGAIANVLARVGSRSSIPALQLLAQHNSGDVAKVAMQGLRVMGEKVPERVAAVPVRFRISINGAPLPPRTSVRGRVTYETANGRSGVGDPFAVDQDGAIALPREWFTDPSRRPIAVSIASPDDSVELPPFDVSTPVPVDLNATTDVNVAMHPLQIVFHGARADRQPPGTVAAITLQCSATDFFSSVKATKLIAPVSEPLSIPPLQAGPYELTISVPGAKRWSNKVIVGPGTVPIEVQLQPGSDVHFVARLPDGKTAVRELELKRDGATLIFWQHYDREAEMLRGLPPGNYAIHIASSEELRRESRPGTGVGPDEIQHAARDLAFTIAENSPATIDLGEIRLGALRK